MRPTTTILGDAEFGYKINAAVSTFRQLNTLYLLATP